MWCLEAVPRLEAASRQIFNALVLVLSQDRDQYTNLQRKIQHNTHCINHCDIDIKSKVCL